MSKTKLLFFLWILEVYASAASLSLTDVNDAQSNQLFSQLISEQEPTVAASAMSSLLSYMAPSIKQIPGYKGLFSGNCSVFFSNTTIEEVGCNIIPVEIISVTDGYQLAAPTRLPGEYATQITQSHILLASLWADWTRKIAQKLEQFEVSLYTRVSTCTHSITESGTQSASETSLSETLSKTAINSHTVSELLSKTVSVSPSDLSSRSSSISDTNSATKSASQSNSSSQSSSKTLSGVASNTLTRMSGLLAAWNASTGAYDDATSQLGRYNASNGVVTDTFTGLNWQQASSNLTMSWDDSVLWCSNRTTGGFNDWRLPNNAELQSLVDYTINHIGITPGINPIFTDTPTSYFYSSTPLVDSPTQQPWWMSFGQTACYSGLLDSLQYSPGCAPAVGYARCVRSPYKPLPAERYATTSDIVTDTITGFIWQRVSTSGAMNQMAAIAYCNALSLPGFSNAWRLPKVKELATLVDYSVPSSNLMMDAMVFAGEPASWFWSSTSVAGYPTAAWYPVFYYGLVAASNSSYTYYVRCVACSVPPTTGVLAAWSQNGGTYDDATNQPDRYNASNGIVTDTLTGIQWQQNASATAMNWTDAAAYCANQSTGSLSGWRVPNIGELGTLVDYTNIPLSINVTVFPGIPTAKYWSSTLDAGNASQAFHIDLSNYGYAYIWHSSIANINQVHCIRSCYPASITTRYSSVSGIVTDIVTALTWQQVSTGGIMFEANALTHCNGLSLPGAVWRLPSLKELFTLMDYSAGIGVLMMSAAAFPNEPAGIYCSTTMLPNNPTQGLYALFNSGGFTSATVATTYCYTRCVACSVPPTTGLLAIWNQAGGTYADSTNQAGRYNASNGIVTDTLTGLEWQQNVSATAMNWTDAATYCANQMTGGLSGWRVPNIGELGTIVDPTIASPYVNTTVFPGIPRNSFWSSTPDAGNTGNFWDLQLGNYGVSGFDAAPTNNNVLCVRSCYLTSSSPRYVVTSGEVADTVTGFVWQQVSTGNTLNQTSAIAHCLGLGLNNHTWRLPTIRELATLVDYSVNQGALMMDATMFTGEPADYFWSSTPLLGTLSAWYVSFFYGTVSAHAITYSNHVRCVACSAPPTTGLLAAWSQVNGTYTDSTNQIGRYNLSNGIVTDTLTGIQWQQNASAIGMNWTKAAAYCANQTTGGFSGWRLPNIGELTTLVDFTYTAISANNITFTGIQPSNCWSSTKPGNSPGNAWEAYFSSYYGGINSQLNTTGNKVRCVRSYYPTPQISRYTTASGEVTDSVTGLIWQQHAPITAGPNNDGLYVWSTALNYCASLGLNGHIWRLPEVKELATLIDYSITQSALMMNPVFAGEPAAYFWSSSPVVGYAGLSWGIYFNDGTVANFRTAYIHNVRCVR